MTTTNTQTTTPKTTTEPCDMQKDYYRRVNTLTYATSAIGFVAVVLCAWAIDPAHLGVPT